MSEPIFPRSPRETMCGWVHLPRYVDKIRLHLAGRLHPDYHANLGQGFDGRWLAAAGVAHARMVEVVRQSITDGEVCDWVRRNVRKTDAEKAAHREEVLGFPASTDAAMQSLLEKRKAEAGMTGRGDITTFVDFIDADEGRST
ncbi:MAG TPA: DUF5069 domain-containing protein [Verrucomicrobiota bacterium]|nr:DUF5069 domain-containing protein [Verrucomicrobiota bacterium]HRZ38394.1 DUF5069 domain-containing protein [Candidatus Paceibacterota bacterium]HRZ56017.1 DUF5069 domain-containing protein [Candidatus Paceibacterota bacterium]